MSETTPTGPLSDAAEIVTMPVAEALEKFNEYKEALRVGRTAHDRMMKAVYSALSKGLGVINPRAAIIKAGVTEINAHPRLAISRADRETVCFARQHSANQAFFSSSERFFLSRQNLDAQRRRDQFIFGVGQLPRIENWFSSPSAQHPLYTAIVKATVPIVPPAHRPESTRLGEYSILWEVEKWEALPRPQRAPGDPMLLKPLGQTGLYAVMAHWDLTDIEKMVLGAMYGS
jgi:hypothetical protein